MISTYDPRELNAPVQISERRWEPRVLVVDDDAISRLAAAGLLQSLGLSVDVATDGREALALSGQWPYVAIFMDCEMPEVDGYTAARQLRTREGPNAHTPVIAMTSKSRSVSLASGMDHHVSKPLEIDRLRADCTQLRLLGRDGAGPSGLAELSGRDTPLLDPSIFPEASAGGRTRPARAGLTFLEEAASRLPELWRSINAADGLSVHALAESLRDAATRTGSQRVADLCERLRQTGTRGGTVPPADIEVQLRGVLWDTREAIRAYVEGVSAPELPTDQMGDPQAASAERVRVAFADDDPVARIALSAMLGHSGWLELVGAAGGVDEIVNLAAVERPDVVVLDWMMPGGGGGEAARRILARTPETLIVALSSSGSLDVLTEMRSGGASCVVAKGGSADQLTQTISRALKARAAARAANDTRRSNRHGTGGETMLDDGHRGESPLDEAGVQRLISEFGSTGVLTDLVDLFGSQTPGHLSELRAAAAAGDSAALHAGAHQLKGGCLTLAAAHMAMLCDELEAIAGNGSLVGAATLVDQIDSEFERTYTALAAVAGVSPGASRRVGDPRSLETSPGC